MTSESTRETPQYVQIAARIRDKIKNGALQPGDPVPSAPSLCTEYGVSMMTAKSALNLLKNEGAVYGIPGKGTYVADNTRIVRTAPDRYFRQRERTYIQETERSGITPLVEHETIIEPATKWVAQRLEIAEGDSVVATSYRVLIDGHQVSMSTSWEPLAITEGTPIEHPHEGPLGDSGLDARFGSIGWNLEQLEEHLFVRDPTPSEKVALNLAPNIPVVELRQTVRATQNNGTELVPIEAAEVVYAANRYEFRYTMDRPRETR